jgi:hypothetical protein
MKGVEVIAHAILRAASGYGPMKTALHAIVLALTALMGLWALGHGIALGIAVHERLTTNQEILSGFVEASVFIAGGICVLGVAVKQLYAWLSHQRDGGLV